MHTIVSEVDNKTILGHVVTLTEICEGLDLRTDYVAPENGLQVAAIRAGYEPRDFVPHKHITNMRFFDLTQEAWYVVRGQVDVFVYDLDDTLLDEFRLDTGDLFIALRGGHSYVTQIGARVLEFKNGPYFGSEGDKVPLR